MANHNISWNSNLLSQLEGLLQCTTMYRCKLYNICTTRTRAKNDVKLNIEE